MGGNPFLAAAFKAFKRERNLPEGESSLCTFKRIGNESHEWSKEDSHNRKIVIWRPIHRIF